MTIYSKPIHVALGSLDHLVPPVYTTEPTGPGPTNFASTRLSRPPFTLTSRQTLSPLNSFDHKDLLWVQTWEANPDAGAEVVVAQANFMPGACLLVFGMYHPSSDATGMAVILELWAVHCRNLHSQDISSEFDLRLLLREDGWDRTLLTASGERKEKSIWLQTRTRLIKARTAAMAVHDTKVDMDVLVEMQVPVDSRPVFSQYTALSQTYLGNMVVYSIPRSCPAPSSAQNGRLFHNDGRPDGQRLLMSGRNRFGMPVCFITPRKKSRGIEFTVSVFEDELDCFTEDEELGRYAFLLA
ncbi:hypothetical protein DL768_005647 [Monosporascus sp. mg162]|nr:hypothetical protein DL768_005647 [Monosporascus sp. mg162]